GSEWQGEAVAFRERKDEIGFTSDSIGTTLIIQRDLLRDFFRPEEPTDHPKGLRGGFRYRVEEFRRSDIDPNLIEDGSVRERDDLVTRVASFLALELRDLPADPKQGSYHFTDLEVGSTALGGNVNFVKFRLEDSWFFSWPPKTVLAVAPPVCLAAPSGGTAAPVNQARLQAPGTTP